MGVADTTCKGDVMFNAKAFANGYNLASGDALHIYSNGYAVAVACTVERHRVISGEIRRAFSNANEARSDDGFLSVWIVLCDTSTLPAEPKELIRYVLPLFVALTDHFSDHRQEDCDTLELAAEMLAATMTEGKG